MEGGDKLPTGLCPLVVFCKPARRRVGEMVENVIHWEKTALADVLKLIFDHLFFFFLSFFLEEKISRRWADHERISSGGRSHQCKSDFSIIISHWLSSDFIPGYIICVEPFLWFQAEVQSVFSDGALSLHTRSLKYGKVSYSSVHKDMWKGKGQVYLYSTLQMTRVDQSTSQVRCQGFLKAGK